ncbi:hypothetical protein ACT29H_07350 [Thermophagus sp. OGC60D27]|uniref:hypothetical protein n=1 Tax=Thermophagus sp. OGC60D27 TaxID=3458415 RepID=UPI004037CE69
MVSDALDVAQLFFSSPKFYKKIRIVAWNPKERLKELIKNGKRNHKKYAETLSLFWDQDSVKDEDIENEVLYNFEKTNKLYFILNRESNKIIGGTSPATMFFAAPDVRKVTAELKIQIGHDKLFDDEYASLPEREPSFIEYIYTLAKQPKFAHYFPEVYEYLEKAKELLSGDITQKIAELSADDLSKYEACCVLENKDDICEVLGIKLGIQPTDTENILEESDFVIQSDYSNNKVKPLVLPNYPFSKKWTYTTKGILWDEKTEVPYKNNDPIDKSKLPIQNDQYYWLSAGNFFEDKIIELPYSIDDSKFITCGAQKHLLPLSPTFFEYFKPERVKQFLTIKERTGGNVDAELKIPVKGGEILLKKQYSSADKNIVQLNVHLAFFPFLKSEKYKITHYIGLLDDREDKVEELGLLTIKNGRQNVPQKPKIRTSGEYGELISKYYSVNDQPDVYGISINSIVGYVIPQMAETKGTSKVNFAIDFGTTNTHMEYQIGNNDPMPLDSTFPTPLLQTLINRNISIDPIILEDVSTFEKEILPFNFSKKKENDEVGFPLRTALIHNTNTDFNTKVEIIKDANNYLLLEKQPVPRYFELNTELKWSNLADTIEEKKIELYLEYLITLAYYKTLQLGGDPSLSTIIWFYPVSMNEDEVGTFYKLWKNVYKKIFQQEPAKRVIQVPESIAPYLYYKSSVEGLSLSIDIGGGSSDIAVFDEDDKKAKLISSFKFAGNAIFGDGYPSKELKVDPTQNGFVQTFKTDVYNVIKNDSEKELILKNILNQRKSSKDFCNFLFALEQEKELNFSFTRLLEKNRKLKLSILIFYGSVTYYSANLLKKAGIDIPKYILLSGTASKTASIIDPSESLNNLSNMIQFIFEKVYNKKADDSIQIKLSSIPKEITCKGVLKAGINENIDDLPIKFWIGGTENDNWGQLLNRETDIQKTPTYGELEHPQMLQIEESIKKFYAVLDEYIQTVRIESKFGIQTEAYNAFKSLRNSGIKDFLIRGIKAFHKNDHESKIEETLFFYPLIGILNKLSFKLSDNKSNNE